MDNNPVTESVWSRGWRDTKSTWLSYPFFILDAIVCVIVGELTMWYWGLAVIAFGMICVWLRATARVPIVQRNEVRAKIKELQHSEANSVNVKHATGKREHDWERTEHLMWAELQVTNIGKQPIEGVVVNIKECFVSSEKQDSVDDSDYCTLNLSNWHQTYVYWSERNADSRQTELNIPSGATRICLIAFQDNSNGGQFYFNSQNHEWFVGGVKITIEISSRDRVLWGGDFYLECGPNWVNGPRARFEFMEWDTWAKGKNITHIPL